MTEFQPGHLVLPLPTFFSATGELDLSAQQRLLEAINRTETQHVILFGSTGEMPSLSLNECRTLLAQADAILQPRFQFHLGVGLHQPADLAQLLGECRRPIVSALFYPNLYFRTHSPNADEYRRAADLLGMPLTLYHLPKVTGFAFTVEWIERLATAGVPLYAVKVSNESLDQVENWKRDDLYRLWWGSERDCQAALVTGAEAIVSQLAACFPEWIGLGDMEETQRRIVVLKGRLDKGMEAPYKLSFIKQVRIDLGFDANAYVRPPQRRWEPEIDREFLTDLGRSLDPIPG